MDVRKLAERMVTLAMARKRIFIIPDLHGREYWCGAAANSSSVLDKKIAAGAMSIVLGGKVESETQYDLADAINFSDISIENFMRMMGFPENMIPFLKLQIEAAMATPEFWEQYRKANPSVQWPPELQAAYERVMAAHKKK